MELSNATESGQLRRGGINFDMHIGEDEISFSHKMTNYGFLSGTIDNMYKEELLPIWKDRRGYYYIKLIVLADDKTKGTLSFIYENIFLQVPFVVHSLELDSDDLEREEEEEENFDYFERKL